MNTMKNYSEYRDFGPCPWWIWNGRMIRSEMLRQLDIIKSSGIDEFFIYAGEGISLPFLEDKWFEVVEWMVGEVKKRNMHVWIYDDLNWPSGTANGMMVHEHPEYRSRSLNGRKMALPPGETFFFNETAAPEGVFIRRDPKGNWERIELDKNFSWLNGTGKEVELFYVFLQYYNYAMMTSCDAANSQAYRGYCDLLNPDAVKCWMGYIHEKYYQRFPQEFGKTVRGFFFDEPFTMHYVYWPGYQCLPWTPGLYEKFQKRFGYDFRDWLPELFYEVNNKTNPRVEKIREDFWTLLSDISANAFSKTIADWCEAHHVQSTGHLVGEECQVDGRFRMLFNGSIWKHLSKHQIPGMDLLTDNSPYHMDTTAHWYGADPNFRRIFSLTVKQPCSTARYTGAKRVMAEAMGVNAANTALNREKVSFDWLAGNGVSMLDDNTLVYTISDFAKNGLTNKHWTQPFFKYYGIFSEYVRTMSRFASENYLDAQTCVFVSDASIYATTPAAFDAPIATNDLFSEPLMATFDALLKDHVEFELLFDDVLLDAKISKGTLMPPNSTFKTIIVPQMTYMPPAIAKKLAQFSKSGGQVIFVGARPQRGADDLSGLQNCQMLMNTDKNFSKKLTAMIKERPYRLVGDGVDMVFSALRGKTLLLSNQSDKRVTFELKTSLPKPWKATTPGDDNAWDFKGTTVVLEPEQSLLLESGAKATGKLPVSYDIPSTGTPIAPKTWDYELSRPNNARPCFEIGLAPNGQSLDDITCWIPCGRDGKHTLDFSPEECPEYWARATFTVKDVPEKLLLVADTDLNDKVLVNGKSFTKSKSYELWDSFNVAFDISSAIKKGVNTIAVHIKTSPHACRAISVYHINEMLQPLVLHGAFGVQYNDARRETILTKLPKSLALGDLTTQGLPSYLGEVTLKTTVKCAKPKAVFLPDVCAGANTVAVNGTTLGTRLWGPYAYDTETATWKKGENEIAVTVCSTLGQLLKRRYGCNLFVEKPYGLFAAPVLL